MVYPMPQALAHKLRFLDKSDLWEALLEYLDWREHQLLRQALQRSESEEDFKIAHAALVAKGGTTEVTNLRNLPQLAKDVCGTETRIAEAKDKRRA